MNQLLGRATPPAPDSENRDTPTKSVRASVLSAVLCLGVSALLVSPKIVEIADRLPLGPDRDRWLAAATEADDASRVLGLTRPYEMLREMRGAGDDAGQRFNVIGDVEDLLEFSSTPGLGGTAGTDSQSGPNAAFSTTPGNSADGTTAAGTIGTAQDSATAGTDAHLSPDGASGDGTVLKCPPAFSGTPDATDSRSVGGSIVEDDSGNPDADSDSETSGNSGTDDSSNSSDADNSSDTSGNPDTDDSSDTDSNLNKSGTGGNSNSSDTDSSSDTSSGSGTGGNSGGEGSGGESVVCVEVVGSGGEDIVGRSSGSGGEGVECVLEGSAGSNASSGSGGEGIEINSADGCPGGSVINGGLDSENGGDSSSESGSSVINGGLDSENGGDSSSDSESGGGGEPAVEEPAAYRRPQPVSIETPLRVYVAGDSQAFHLGHALRASPLKKALEVTLDQRHSTGLARPEYFNWPVHMVVAVIENDPELLVMTLGSNDWQDLNSGDGRIFGRGSSEWIDEWGRRLRVMLDALRAVHRKIVWVGLPPTQSGHLREGYGLMNTIAAQAAEERDFVTMIDIWEMFGGDQPYRASVPPPDNPDGTPVGVRNKDGVHVNRRGANWVAELITEHIHQHWDTGTPTS